MNAKKTLMFYATEIVETLMFYATEIVEYELEMFSITNFYWRGKKHKEYRDQNF